MKASDLANIIQFLNDPYMAAYYSCCTGIPLLKIQHFESYMDDDTSCDAMSQAPAQTRPFAHYFLLAAPDDSQFSTQRVEVC